MDRHGSSPPLQNLKKHSEDVACGNKISFWHITVVNLRAFPIRFLDIFCAYGILIIELLLWMTLPKFSQHIKRRMKESGLLWIAVSCCFMLCYDTFTAHTTKTSKNNTSAIATALLVSFSNYHPMRQGNKPLGQPDQECLCPSVQVHVGFQNMIHRFVGRSQAKKDMCRRVLCADWPSSNFAPQIYKTTEMLVTCASNKT